MTAQLPKHREVLIRATPHSDVDDVLQVDDTTDSIAVRVEFREVIGDFCQNHGVGAMLVIEPRRVQDRNGLTGDFASDRLDSLRARIEAVTDFDVLTRYLFDEIALAGACDTHHKDDLG